MTPLSGGCPRSTPIPGVASLLAPDDIRGHVDASRPPRPSEFVQAQTSAPTAPYAPPPGGQRPVLPGMDPELQDFTFVPLTRRGRRRNRGWFGWLLMIVFYAAGPVAGIGAGVWALLEAQDAMDEASELSDPTLSARDRDALGLPDGVETLFEADAPLRIASLYETTLAGEPTKFDQIVLYPDYAFATVQDAAAPTHLDQYQWRSGTIGTPSAQPSSGLVESSLFAAGDINWAAVSQVAAQAPALVPVEGGHVTHITVDHSTFQPSFAAVVRIYVNGDRGSGYVEMAPTGEILGAH